MRCENVEDLGIPTDAECVKESLDQEVGFIRRLAYADASSSLREKAVALMLPRSAFLTLVSYSNRSLNCSHFSFGTSLFPGAPMW